VKHASSTETRDQIQNCASGKLCAKQIYSPNSKTVVPILQDASALLAFC